MRFTLRQLLAAVALLAIVCVVVAPYFQPARTYLMDGGSRSMATWFYGEVQSCFAVRGFRVPTVVFGFGGSDFVGPGPEQLPFAVVLLDEPSELFSIDSEVYFGKNEKGPRSITTISGNGNQVVVSYGLFAESTGEPPVVVESFEIDGNEYDLSAGRLFTVDERGDVKQLKLLEIDMSVLPRRYEGGEKEFSAFLDWWRTVQQEFAIDDW